MSSEGLGEFPDLAPELREPRLARAAEAGIFLAQQSQRVHAARARGGVRGLVVAHLAAHCGESGADVELGHLPPDCASE